MASQGQNLYNLGGKLKDSSIRKPPALGFNMDSSFEIFSEREEDIEAEDY